MPFEGDVVSILQIGVIGLGFLLAVLSYHLLTKEQKQDNPRPEILKSVYIFMFFSVVLCVVGIISQVLDIKEGDGDSPSTSQRAESSEDKAMEDDDGNESNVLYNYFVYSVGETDIQLCNISEFRYSEKSTGTENTSIEGEIKGTIYSDGRPAPFENHAFGNKNKYYLKIMHDDGVAFLENEAGDYVGYWIGESGYSDADAVICPIVFSPNVKGLSVEEAKAKWPILNEPCRVLSSLGEISG